MMRTRLPKLLSRRAHRAAALVAALTACAMLFPREAAAQKVAPVRVTMGTMTLETYEEGVPNVNPPFDQFSNRVNYPYTLRDNLTDKHAPQAWRTLTLENAYLRCIVLPDLGGHLYTCIDTINGASLFYANPSIKKANIAYRGAWSALGIEFNFPVSHNWLTVSPVDFQTTRGADGSATIWVGAIDRVYGGEWRVALTLRPGEARLEQRTWLYNRSPLRHRFYWWTNAAVESWDDETVLVYPMSFTASHGFTDIDTWPVTTDGVDLSRVATHSFGPVSRFSHGSREPFMAVYHTKKQTGVAHYSSPDDLPSKKVWSWGNDADAMDWRRALSDNNSAYVEVQAGLFRNQETYAFLQPEESISFVEYWMPVRGLGGVTRVGEDAVLHLARAAGAQGAVAVGLNAASTIDAATVVLRCGDGYERRERVSLSPARVWTRRYADAPAAPCTFSVRDARGRVRLTHTEGVRDEIDRGDVPLGAQPRPPKVEGRARTDGEILDIGDRAEREGRRLVAWDLYAAGLRQYPDSAALHKAAGRLAVALKRDAEAASHLDRALAVVSNDPEAHYYAGVAASRLGRTRAARTHFELAQQFEAYRAPARLELAGLAGRAGALDEALAHAAFASMVSPSSVRAAHAHAVLLRAAGRTREAAQELARGLALAPLDNALRYESILQGESTLQGEATRRGRADADLAAHLAGDPERVLDVAIAYMRLGRYADAVALLDRRFPSGPSVVAEPGTASPETYPLVAYYRGYCRRQMQQSGDADYAAASKQSTTYVFPNRAETAAVLRDALTVNGNDQTARFLLGALSLSGGDTAAARDAWETVRRARPDTPVLHRNLGLTLLHGEGAAAQAVEVLTEGLAIDPRNVELYLGLDQALSITGATPAVRAGALERYPDRAGMPAMLVFKLAQAYAEAEKFDAAEALFAGRFFPREEGGTNVRQVYLDLRLRRASALARAGRCADATSVLDTLAAPVAGLAFTQDGLDTFLREGRHVYAAAGIRATCGQADAAAAQWRALAVRAGKGSFVDTLFAWMAAARLGEARPSPDRVRTLIADAQRQLDESGTSSPGLVLAAQGLAFTLLGQSDDARRTLTGALLAQDRRLSHALARDIAAGRLPDPSSAAPPSKPAR